MATTPNFNWSTPDNTGLVKNGALDIRTLGNSIDASMADLKGGTTGQVLKKATNTDMDFVWSADSTGMTNPMTTTGDTIYSSSGSTPARLGIGSTGQVLTVAGGLPTWATPSGGGSGFTLITSSSFSGTTSHSVNNCFSSTYTNYRILWNFNAFGNEPVVNMRLRASGTDTSSTTYNRVRLIGQLGSAASATADDTFWQLVYGDDGQAYASSVSMDIYAPQAANRTTAIWNFVGYSPNDMVGAYSGKQSGSTQFDGFTFYTDNSTNFSGTVRIYGYSN